MTDLFSWNEDPAGDDDVFFASTSRSIDDGSFQLYIQGENEAGLAEWDESAFASFEDYEHLLGTEVEADSDYAHYLQSQSFDIDHLLSPPAKSSSSKKRVSPAKDITHKRAKPSDQRNSNWKHRPDHLDVLGSSFGSGSGSLGTSGLHDNFLASTTGISPTHTLGMLPELGMDGSLAVFGGDELDGHMPLATSTPQSTPMKLGKKTSPGRNGAYPQTAAAAAAGKKISLDWSDDEIRLFEEGVVLYGVGNWRQVAALVGTRNTAQVKTFSTKYFMIFGANHVPHVDAARLEELRSQYLPNSNPQGMLKTSQRLKRSSTAGFAASASTLMSTGNSPALGHPQADKKLAMTPKKTGNSAPLSAHSTPPHGHYSSNTTTPPKQPGAMATAVHNSNSKLLSPGGNKGPQNRPAKGPSGSQNLLASPSMNGMMNPAGGLSSSQGGVPTPGRRKADEQLIVLKKTGDEDEDICIEDEEDIDIDGNDDQDEDSILLRRALLESDGAVNEDHASDLYDDTPQGADPDVDIMSHPHPSQYMQATGSILDAHSIMRSNSAASSGVVSGASSVQQTWRKRAQDYALDESGSEYITEDSLGGYLDADSSLAGSETVSLADSSSSIGAANAFSVAQALKALGLDGEAWIHDVEIPPTRVLELQEDQVLDLEMQANSEFFEGNNVKTPERYVRIRNHILRTWLMNKQRYVTKTSVRRGLRDCGDVNAIGRVHQFLELVGAINFGLEAPPSCRKQGQPEPLSVLMMSKGPVQQHMMQSQSQQQQQQSIFSPSLKAKSSAYLSASSSAIGAPTYASVVAGTHHSAGGAYGYHGLATSSPAAYSKPTSIRCQFDPTFEVIKNPPVNLPFLLVSSNTILVMDLHAHMHRRDGFGLIAGHWNPDSNTVTLRHAIPYTGPQSSPASSLQAVSAWEKTVTQWLDNSTLAKTAAISGTPLEILGYYTTHKLNGALSLTQFTHYKNVYCKGVSRNRPFVGIFAVPFERTADGTQFQCVMYPTGTNPGGMPQKTLYSLKRNVYCDKKLPQEQFAQLFSAYGPDSDVALRLTERDDRDPHRTLLDRCFVSLSSAVFVSERDKNAMWEHMRALANEGVNDKLLSMLNTKDAVWSFREPPASLASEMPGYFLGGSPFDPTQKLDFAAVVDPLGPAPLDDFAPRF